MSLFCIFFLHFLFPFSLSPDTLHAPLPREDVRITYGPAVLLPRIDLPSFLSEKVAHTTDSSISQYSA
jgi:hypothetical protein